MKRFQYIALVVVLLGVDSLPAKIYKGAEYRTKESFLYGRFSARIKTNGREGMLTSFFTYNDNYPTTPWNEIDIEVMGRYTDDVQFNPITPGQVNHVSHQYIAFNPSVDYHVYGFEWTPAYVAWFIDSVEVYRQTGDHITSLNLPQKLMMNVWLPAYEDWAGVFNEAVLPAYAYYDWIRYDAWTPDSGSVGTGGNFSPRWIDNCDAWDQARWEKASHTFGGNNVDFIPANAVFSGGKLVLCLTKETATGYADGLPPAVRWARAEGDSVIVFFSEEVEKASAELASHYTVPGVTVDRARLRDDCRTVVLSAPGLSAITSPAVLVSGIRDRWSVPNTLSSATVPLYKSKPLAFPVKINVGGAAVGEYLADQVWTDKTEYGRVDGYATPYADAVISGTTDQAVFSSEGTALCEYNVRVPNGKYLVILMFAENYFSGANNRVMKIRAEGAVVDGSLDLAYRAGFRTAYMKSATVDVTDGVLSLHFQGMIGQPILNGLSITSLGSGVGEERPADPESFRLYPNFPNPFNGGTMISFSIPRDERLTLKVFDTLGRMVCETPMGEWKRGAGSFAWHPSSAPGGALASGMYVYCIEGSQRSVMQKMMYVK